MTTVPESGIHPCSTLMLTTTADRNSDKDGPYSTQCGMLMPNSSLKYTRLLKFAIQDSGRPTSKSEEIAISHAGAEWIFQLVALAVRYLGLLKLKE